MPDLILGQPTNLTTVTDNGAGFCRVTFAPWELDWEFYLGIAVDGTHYIANTTVGNSSAITARGGAENLGYWFDTNRAFPGGWVTGNRCSPQRQAGIQQFLTFAAAVAAMAFDDIFLLWYRNAANLRQWGENLNFVNIAGGVWGMLSRAQIAKTLVAGGTNGIGYTGNLAGQAVQAPIKNLNIIMHTVNNPNVLYSPDVGQSGAGILVDRCFLSGAGSAGSVARTANAAADSVHLANSVITRSYNATGNLPAHRINFCTAINCASGFNLNGVIDPRNLVVAACEVGFVNAAAAQNCADTDGTLPVHATNLRNQDMRTQLQFFHDLARPGDKAFDLDFRIHQDSVLNGAGAVVVGLANDADGRVRPDPPSIGAYEPYSTCYAPAAEIIRGVGRRGAGA